MSSSRKDARWFVATRMTKAAGVDLMKFEYKMRESVLAAADTFVQVLGEVAARRLAQRLNNPAGDPIELDSEGRQGLSVDDLAAALDKLRRRYNPGNETQRGALKRALQLLGVDVDPPALTKQPPAGTHGPICCSGGDCCGPGSYCCTNAGPHTHDDDADEAQTARLRNAVGAVITNASNYPDAITPHILGRDLSRLIAKVTTAAAASIGPLRRPLNGEEIEAAARAGYEDAAKNSIFKVDRSVIPWDSLTPRERDVWRARAYAMHEAAAAVNS